MSKDIYIVQETLDSILNTKRTKYEYTDAVLFDCSDYPNNGKDAWRYFDWTGLKHTEETKRYMSEAQKKRFVDHPISDETRKIWSEQRKGVPWKNAEERKKKLIARRTGSKHSEATKQKMREARLKNNPGGFKKGNVNGKNKE